MVMWLMYSDQLYTLYKVMGLEIQQGSFGVTEVKRLFLPKMLFPPYRLYAMVMWLKYIDQLYTLAIYSLQKLLV